jgi:hypothetical protein
MLRALTRELDALGCAQDIKPISEQAPRYRECQRALKNF